MILDISGSLDRERETSARPRNMSIKEVKERLKKLHGDLESPKISQETKRYIRKYLINEHLVELYKKAAIPFACLAFGLIGVPVGLLVRRGGRMVGLGVGVGLIIIYYVLLTAGEKLAKVGIYPPILGAWTPNILTSVAGIILIIKTVRETPVRSSRLINKLFPPRTQYGENFPYPWKNGTDAGGSG
jgi:lipopolysaccharide export LptBFGC system permease protein LptF